MTDELSLDFLRQLVLEQRSQIQDPTKKISAAIKHVEAAENYTSRVVRFLVAFRGCTSGVAVYMSF